jgi:hypothetical protein
LEGMSGIIFSKNVRPELGTVLIPV